MDKEVKRKRNRLQNYDYSDRGWYFVTVCTQNKKEWFGKIDDEEMRINEYGEIVKTQWQWLARQYNYVMLDEFTVMPNHIHGILVIDNYADR